MSTKFKAVWIEFPTGNRAYGGGGWSRNAKHRPAPERREIITDDVIITTGQSVLIGGRRKLKVNLFKAATGEIIRADYPLYGLTAFGLTTRQIAARKRVEKARSAKLDAAMQAAAEARVAKHRVMIAAMPQDVAGWIAAGCQHPAPPVVVQAKEASGLSWSMFEKGGSL